MISVIISARNEETHLEETLTNLRRCAPDDMVEIVVAKEAARTTLGGCQDLRYGRLRGQVYTGCAVECPGAPRADGFIAIPISIKLWAGEDRSPPAQKSTGMRVSLHKQTRCQRPGEPNKEYTGTGMGDLREQRRKLCPV